MQDARGLQERLLRLAQQTALITQDVDGDSTANATQDSNISQ